MDFEPIRIPDQESGKIIYLQNRNRDEYIKGEIDRIEPILEETRSISREFSAKYSDFSHFINKLPDSITKRELFILSKNLWETHNALGLFFSSLEEYILSMQNDLKSSWIGNRGETVVERELELHKHNLVFLKNITLDVDGQSVENDFFVFGRNRLFNVEVKNYGHKSGGKIKISEDGKWTREDRFGKPIEISDITQQVYRHIGLSERFIERELKGIGINEKIYIYPIVVIANDNIDIENETSVPVLRKSSIYHYIKYFESRDPEISTETQKTIRAILVDNAIEEKTYPFLNKVDVYERELEKIRNANDYLDGILESFEEIEKMVKREVRKTVVKREREEKRRRKDKEIYVVGGLVLICLFLILLLIK